MLFVVIVPRRQQGCVLNARRLDRSLKKQLWAMSSSVLMGVEGQYPQKLYLPVINESTFVNPLRDFMLTS